MVAPANIRPGCPSETISNRSCTTLALDFVPGLCPLGRVFAALIHSYARRPHHSFTSPSSRVYQTCVSLVLFSIVISCLFHFFWIPLRSVHSCHSVERISHTPLDTSATLTLCATHRPKRSTTSTTYYLVDSDQEQHSQPSVVHSLPRSITRSISFNLLYTVPLLHKGNT